MSGLILVSPRLSRHLIPSILGTRSGLPTCCMHCAMALAGRRNANTVGKLSDSQENILTFAVMPLWLFARSATEWSDSCGVIQSDARAG